MKKYFFLILIFCSIILSCKQNISSYEILSDKGIIKIERSSNARTILPNPYDFDNDLSISFKLTIFNQESTDKTETEWISTNSTSAYAIMTTSEDILLDAGIYDFTLESYKNDNAILIKKITNKEIVPGINCLDFGTMNRTTLGYGALDVSFSFPYSEAVTEISCCLYDMEGNILEGFDNETLILINKDNETYSVSYNKQNVPVGTYRICFTINNNNICLNTYREIIQINAELCSKAQRSLNNINQYYPLTYYNVGEYNGADDLIIPEGSLIEYYNCDFNVTLPTNISRTYYSFDGWYLTSDFSGEPITEIKAGEYKNNINLYAKWVTNTQNVINAINQLSGEECVIIYLSDYSESAYSYDKSNSIPITNTPFILDLTDITNSSLPEYAFYNWNTLINIKWGNNITELQNYCFAGCSSITKLVIPETVEKIGNYCFSGCSNLTDFVVYKNVKEVGYRIFNDCPKMKLIIGSTAFLNPERFTYSPFYVGSGFEVEIMNNITEIPVEAFYGCGLISSITLPETIETIGADAFRDCSGLKTIFIPKSVTSIGSNAFRGCSTLSNIDLPNIIELCRGCFANCKSLESFSYPQNMLSVPAEIFEGCTKLENIILADEITIIESKAFYGCESLTTINIPNSIKTIENSAFYNCINITNLNIPSSIKEIGENAFYSCQYAFSELDLNSSDLLKIGKNAFYGCSSLVSITIPNITKLNEACFYNCSSLQYVNIPTCMTEIPEEIFMNCSSLKSIILPEKITIIGKSAFNNCSSLQSLNLPNAVVKLCPYFIYKCTAMNEFTYSGGQTSWKCRGEDDSKVYLTPTSGYFTLRDLRDDVARYYWAKS